MCEVLKIAAVGCALALLLASPASASASDGSKTVSADKAKMLAKAGVLTKKDLAGYEQERLTATKQDDKAEAALYKCLGVPAPAFTARNRGFSYASPAEPMDIETLADVANSTKAAKRYFRAVKSAKAPGCLEEQLAAFAERNGSQAHGVKIVAKKITVRGVDGAIAFRYRATFEGQFGSLKITYCQILMRVGQTEITLRNDRYDGKHPGLKLLSSLTERLVKRVRAV